MRLFVTILFAVVASCSAQQQHQQVDPAYLRQYYAQQNGAEEAQRAAPIYESQEQPEYLQQAKGVSWRIFSPLSLIGGLGIVKKRNAIERIISQFPRQQPQQHQAYVQEPQARQYQQPQQVISVSKV